MPLKCYKALLIAMAAASLLGTGCGNTPPPAATTSAATSEAPAATISEASETYCAEGLRFYQAFDYDKAIAAYDKAIAADGNNYKAYSGKGVAQCMSGNAQGIKLIQKALQMKPDYVPAFYDLALAYKLQHDYDHSIQWFQKVIEKEPDNTWSYYGIATIYGDQGNAREATAYLKKAIALDGENVKAAARSQAHFDSIRNTPEFQKLVQ